MIDADGSVLTGLSDGRIIRLQPMTSEVSVVADTGGRPLGLEWLPDGRLLVCDAIVGLLSVELDRSSETNLPTPSTGLGRVETLADMCDDIPIRIANNAAVGAGGTVWFTDSSARHDFEFWKADILEHQGTGRLIRRDPDGQTTTICSDLQFANGVALAPDESALFIAETANYSIDRIPLIGRNAGTREPFAQNLPGFPDNLSIGPDGLLWVAIASPRLRAADLLAPRQPMWRRVVWRVPQRFQPQPGYEAAVMAFDLEGSLVHDIRGTHPEFGMSTGVRRHGDAIWLGSLTSSAIACFPLSDVKG